MRRLLGFLVFVAIVVVAFGFWRGWFTVNRAQIQHDTKELRHDAKHEAEKLKEELHTGAQKVEQKTDN